MSTRRPSDNWNGFGDLEPGPGSLHEQVQTVLSTANFRDLEKLAYLARIQQDRTVDPGLLCTINTSLFTYGFNNVVLEVSFSDHVYWIAKIQHISVDESEASENAMDLLSEIVTMRTVKERTSIPVPQVFAYDISRSNSVGYPYILMEHIDGQALGGPLVSEVPPRYLLKVARQLAEIFFELHGLTFDRLGRLWCGENGDGAPEIIPLSLDNEPEPDAVHWTSLEWFYKHRQENNRQVLKLHPHDPEWRTACWVLKTAVPHIIIEPRVHGPFPLCHADLHHGNLLFDDDYNLKGVIDWSQAQTVPLERLVVSPEIITFPGISDEQNNDILAFISLVREHIQHLEQKDKITPTLLSDFFGTKRAEVTHRCTYSLPHRALWDGRLVARLLYGNDISWEQLVRVYGEVEIC